MEICQRGHGVQRKKGGAVTRNLSDDERDPLFPTQFTMKAKSSKKTLIPKKIKGKRK